MSISQTVAGIIVFVLSVFFGVNENALNSVVDWIDPPAAGTARVQEVVDGDTIVVRFGNSTERVRFIGVDTPETNHPDKAVQCYGNAATQYLSDLLNKLDVRLEADPTNTNRDRFDRLLRYVYLQDGTLVNRKIIEEGYGFAYTIFPFEKLDEFREAQNVAADEERGLWGSCDIEFDDGVFNSGEDLGAAELVYPRKLVVSQ
jgi:endonuclease YncB( thermonuclease family)